MENVGLALPHIHYNPDEIIRRFARLHLRRMELANIQNRRATRRAERMTLRASCLKKIH